MNFDKNFWKEYGFTVVQILLFGMIVFSAYALIILSLSTAYPFMQVLNEMQISGNVDAFANELLANEQLFSNFLIYLMIIILSYTIIISGVLSLLDRIILSKLKNTNFSMSKWIFDWFRYSCISLLFLMILYVMFYAIDNVNVLFVLFIASLLIYSYLIILIQFDKNIFYLIKNTLLRAGIVLLLNVTLFIISLLIIGLLSWIGFIIAFLLFAFLLLWSKIFLMKNL